MGVGPDLLGIETRPIEAFVPVLMFAIVFGLSLGCEVSLLSRIHEERERGRSACSEPSPAPDPPTKEYLDAEKDPARREEVFAALLAEEAQLRTLPEKYRRRIREEEKLMALLRRAHEAHEVDAPPPQGVAA